MIDVHKNKSERLRSLCTPGGVIAALAMDQRKSLRRMIACAGGRPLEQVSDADLGAFKAAVSQALTPEASAILLDPEYGMDAADRRAPSCGLLLAYESDGYENPRPHRMLELMPRFSVRRLAELGADGIKILLSYTPFDDEAANDAKRALVERIGHECESAGLPFFLEPVGYDPSGAMEPNSPEFARLRPEIVVRSMEEFSRDIYKVDILKVEFPVNAAFVGGSPVQAGAAVYSHREALDWYRQADSVARRPYIYLSAGVGAPQFVESLRMAAESGARFSGVLCGRATWQDGVTAFARGGGPALAGWLRRDGVANIQAVNECLKAAVGVETAVV